MIHNRFEKPIDELTLADLDKINRMTLNHEENLHDVKGLEKFTQLTSLWLFGNPDNPKKQII